MLPPQTEAASAAGDAAAGDAKWAALKCSLRIMIAADAL